ncbi:serine hydrolase domain-containing protein [Corallincola platygyrae]|uniref:Serine hydrolase domain-containing protein n=1 Tax=Corallincola platygyrae TaxID=1193278 RepID=A0ABW4XHM7_9GAMM
MKFAACVTLVLASLTAGCNSDSPVQYQYQPPQKLDDGIEVGTLPQINIDEKSIGVLVDAIAEGDFGEIHSMLVLVDGKLVVEEYFPGHDFQWGRAGFHGAWTDWDSQTKHNVHSVGKSITAATIGIAIEMGLIKSTQQSIFDYLPKHQHLKTEAKANITIEHLLTMTSGLAWDEWGSSYQSDQNDVINLWFKCPDPIECILAKPMESSPGERFNYSGGNIILLGEIIKHATDMDIEQFANTYLFKPLGIKDVEWLWIAETDVVYAAGDQKLTPREMLKFGMLFLNDGQWHGQKLLSPAWVAVSATPFAGPDSQWNNHMFHQRPPGDATSGQRGYSYGWWTHQFSGSDKDIPAYWAYGWGGQRVMLFPEQNAVVVMTGANYSSKDYTADVINDHLLPAMLK